MLTCRQDELADVKRFLELFVADPAFRREASSAPSPLGQRIRALWDSEVRSTGDPLETAYLALLQSRQERRQRARQQAEPVHPRFRAWRRRQIHRATSQLGRTVGELLVHHPAAIELSLGCSVGCSFCAVSAGKLKASYSYLKYSQDWQDALRALLHTLGPAAGQSVCYWATDPFDNPDYERFLLDFHRLIGNFPPTTTALADRALDRTRNFLISARERGCSHNRFSVLSLAQLRRLHAEFSAQELLEIELVLQNRDSLTPRARAGRAFREGEVGSTIACVSGFLINMVEGSVALVSPCPASQRWPEGYRIQASANFSSGQQLQDALDHLTSAEFMPDRLPRERPVQFRTDLRWDGQQLVGRYANHRIEPLWLAEEIALGLATPAELAENLRHRAPLEHIFFHLNRMFTQGVFDDDIPST